MNRLVFEVQAPVVAADPNRADIACFAGFVARRKNTAVPAPVMRWLEEQGWTAPARNRPDIDDLLDVPVPIDSWEVFDHLFEWERRLLNDTGRLGTTYLGAAVRSFFSQGGRKCYVVRVDDPWTYMPTPPEGLSPAEARLYARCRRVSKMRKLLPGFQLPGDCFSLPQSLPPDEDHIGLESSPVDRLSWRGIGHIFGLPDISFLCLPDLPDAIRAEDEPIDLVEYPQTDREVFVECSAGEEAAPIDRGARFFRAPRCDDEGYRLWVSALRIAANLISRRQREVQLVAAIPIPDRDSAAERDLYGFLARPNEGSLSQTLDASLTGLSSVFVQLAYPWVRTPGSSDLPERLESPDAVIVGILARSALTRGAFHSAASLPLGDVYDLFPILRRSLMFGSPERRASRNRLAQTLLARVSLFGPTPAGLTLLSDVTTSLDESYRPAGINRLVSAIVRAARRLGEASTFEPSGEQVWASVRERLNIMLAGLLADGGLSGESEDDAFQVRCDRSTMSQNDIDNGRVVAEIRFQAAAPVEQITIVLALDEGGQVSLISTRIPDPVKEAA
jgi:hypothetical protein